MFTMYNGRQLKNWELAENETLKKEYYYCGHDIKVISINNENEEPKFYCFSKLNFKPSLHYQIFAAEKEIEDFIDTLEVKKEE